MPRGRALLLVSLLLAAPTLLLGSPVKDKRGWTLNSAGYLLGPHALDNHRSFRDKHGPSGKRALRPEEGARPGSFARPLPQSEVARALVELLTFLRLKEAGTLPPALPPADSSEDPEQPVLREPGPFMSSREARL